ncbi:hypothetical protein N9F19_03990 [Gammaproteobacteria bacterium]|nr:hypothetical protein [Gammaproteobacteria bacterium]
MAKVDTNTVIKQSNSIVLKHSNNKVCKNRIEMPFKELIKHISKKLMGYAMTLSNNDQDDAWDLIQSTMVKLIKNQDKLMDSDQPNSTYHNSLVSLEIICTSDIELRNEICNSRNTQNPVMLQSRLQQQNVFDDLNRSMGTFSNQKWKIDGRETSQTDIPVAKLIQITRLFLPNEVFEGNVKKAYVGATSCLTNYETWYKGKDGDKKEIYKFMNEFAPIAWTQYLKWNSHPAWKGNFLREDDDTNKSIGTRMPDGNWTEIKNGVLFPILRSLHTFVKWDGKNAEFDSSSLDESGLIKNAIKYLREECKNNPQTMGKDDGAYKTLSIFAQGLDIRV